MRRLMETFRNKGEIDLTDNGAPIDDPVFRAGRGTTEDTLAAIRDNWEKHSYLMDPHTAVGVSVGRRFAAEDPTPMVCLSTAHPAKFGAAIARAIGQDIASHPLIDALKGAKTRVTRLPADAAAVAAFVADNV